MIRTTLTTLGVALLLTGCAGRGGLIPDGDTAKPSTDPEPAISEQLAGFLADATRGEQAGFGVTPWGNDTVLRAGERYYAASGRICRALQVRDESDSALQAALACRTQTGWERVDSLSAMMGVSNE